jgi:hypothetical protein
LTFGHVSRRVFRFGRCKRCAGNGDNRRQCNGSYYADLPHESPPKGVASWQTEMSTLLLNPRRVTCGAVYEQLMNKKFQQGRGSVHARLRPVECRCSIDGAPRGLASRPRMNPRGNSNMGAGRSNSQPFLKDSCRANLAVRLKGPYSMVSFDHEASGTRGEATIHPECQRTGLSSHRSGCSRILPRNRSWLAG